MPQYWWVNHKQTFNQEIEGQYLWSPKTDTNGRHLEHYDNMRRAAPNDLVISFADAKVRYVGRVAEFAFTASKPEEFGKAGANWRKEGWYLPVFWTRLDPAVRPKDWIQLLRPLLPDKFSPLKSDGDGNLFYLTKVSKAVFDTVVAAASVDYAQLLRGGQNSLSYQTILDRLDEEAERRVEIDPSLDSTTRSAVIQARRGQGTFRANVEKFEKSCRITGVKNPTLLIASHIKPWRSCDTSHERLDGMNGLMLTPDADLLFDRGFITFRDDGEVEVSPRFDADDLQRLGLGNLAWKQLGLSEASARWQTSAFSQAQCTYLEYHRAAVFVGEIGEPSRAKTRRSRSATPSR